MRLTIIFILCGAAIIWASGSLAASSSDDLDKFERLRAGVGETTTGTVTDVYERTQRTRRSTITTYCPVVTYEYLHQERDQYYESEYIDRIQCESSAADVELGVEVPVIYDPASAVVFTNTDAVAEALQDDVGRNRWLWWLGVVIVSLGGLGLVLGIVELVSRFRSRSAGE